MELEALLRAVRDKEDGAAERLVAGATQPLFSYIRSRGVPPAVAEELAHDVLMVAFDRLPGLDHPSLRAWLFGVARNLSAQYHRRVGRRPETRLSNARNVAVPGHNLSSWFRRQDLRAKVIKLIEKMDTPLRELAQLDLVGGDLVAYAKRENLSMSGMRTRRQRYLERLRNDLDGT